MRAPTHSTAAASPAAALAVAASVLAAASLVVAIPAHAQGPTPVGVDAVRTEPLAQTVPVNGRLVALRSGGVASRVDAPVAEVLVQVGDRVKAGQVLVRLDSEAFDLAHAVAISGLGQARSQVTTEQAKLELARLARVRLEQLKRTRATARADADDARQSERVSASEVARARTAVVAAQAEANQAALAQRYARITAPYAGVIAARLAEKGEFVRAGDVVIKLVGDEQLELEAAVPYERLAGLTSGTQVRFTLDDGTAHVATVRGQVPIESSRTRTRPVRFVPSFSETRVTLAAEQNAVLQVPAGPPRDVVTVHKDAITRRGPQALVYVVVDGVANPRPVRLGEAVGNRLEVTGGLQDGDVTVIRGNERLRPGAQVMVGGPAGDSAKARPAS